MSTVIAIWTVLGMNMASILVEYVCIEKVCLPPTFDIAHHSHSNSQVYKSVPALERRVADEETPPDDQPTSRLSSFFTNIIPLSSVPFYIHHPAFLPSFSLSLLYLTVLSFSGQMITYLMSVGYTPLYVGIARTGSTIVELSATWAAPRLMRKIGPIRGGLWSINWQMGCLAVGVCWYIVDMNNQSGNQLISATVLAICVAFSRLGLWGYDLCAQNIVQDVSPFQQSHSWSIRLTSEIGSGSFVSRGIFHRRSSIPESLRVAFLCVNDGLLQTRGV